ncbi:hypothetical protein SAMN03159423_0328 [Bradyrhizobium sp. NFR13]|uniref:hypothetical protein n=1 Tax=Bradyrhizobium sp. NFR13 TaxID=1566285 RepID=UPI0008F3A627|nr:hypothetical protein [Bradyrhizobium sp. NFR13]SFM27148.1 hypothetical protein SAMN03159423_0328 [Bradyrhizobium sp. NFR13]
MRLSAIIATLSGIATLWSGYCFSVTSTGLDKAARIRANPNGDVVWLERWETNREASIICGIIFFLIFVWAFAVLYKAQRDDTRTSRAPE